MLRSVFTLLFLLVLVFARAQQLDVLQFSSPAGFYPDSIYVSIISQDDNVEIHYTLNGNEPTELSPLYSDSILIKSRIGELDSYSAIPTNPGFNYPINGYDSIKANTRGWLPPFTESYKSTVLKAKAFGNGNLSSPTAIATYFIDPLLSNRFSMSVLSLTTDSVNLFSNETGIYVYGNDTIDGGNYNMDNAEREVHFELFEPDGTLGLSQDCGILNHGGGGKLAPQKSFKMVARTSYGSNSFDYPLFTDKNTDKFKSFLLRNGGHRPDCYPRDDLAGQIVKNMNFEVQYTRHVIVFINGEYWGIQSIKDILDEHYLENKYNVNDADVAVLVYDGTVDDGLPNDNQHYLNMRNFAVNNDMTDTNNYNYISTQMDIENFVDYQNSEIYLGNGDWPHNNIKYWRYRSLTYNPLAGVNLDGRWRWMMYDLDGGFGGDCTGIYFGHNALVNALSPTAGNYTLLLRSLLVSPKFKNLFINRCADLMNTEFLPSRVSAIAAATNAEITPEMTEHVNRWRYPSVDTTLALRANEIPSLTKWNTINSSLQTFATRRASKIRQHYMDYFSLPDTADVMIDVSDTAAGRVQFSTLIIDENTVGVIGSAYPWIGKYFTTIEIPIKAIARPGYRFVNWINTNITNPDTVVVISSDTSFTAVFEKDPDFVPFHHLYINELSASNANNIADEYGEYDDWFEIYNPNNFPVDIDNYYVTDSLANKTKYRFASGSGRTIIPANGFLMVWADEETEQGVLHTNFKLSSTGEELALVLPDGETVVDSIIFGSMTTDRSWGRQTDGDETWVDFSYTTPGFSNNQTVGINELEYSPPFAVYPNPAKSTEKIFFNKVVSVSFHDALGQLISSSENVVFFNISELKAGVYFIKTDKGELLKFIKL
jgi:hypothetical protein